MSSSAVVRSMTKSVTQFFGHRPTFVPWRTKCNVYQLLMDCPSKGSQNKKRISWCWWQDKYGLNLFIIIINTNSFPMASEQGVYPPWQGVWTQRGLSESADEPVPQRRASEHHHHARRRYQELSTSVYPSGSVTHTKTHTCTVICRRT